MTPPGYFGAEKFFGRMDTSTDEDVGGLDVVREVSDEDLAALEHGTIPASLTGAVLDFVLAGSARAQRGGAELPATMLVHTSQRILVQSNLRRLIGDHYSELRDEWRYQRTHGIRDRLRERWESEFRPVTRSSHLDRDVPFETIEPFIGPFLEAVQVREINSSTGEVLDYEREPALKAIAIGGNRLSRGLTLEGLLVSFFIRRSATYDTLMQMGRWFGFRGGYEDLTRIHTTPELESWFYDLALVEHRLREDIQVYEAQGLTPYEVGMRIWQHPTMQVTSPLKRRFASSTTIAQSFAMGLEQTFKFPLRRLEDLALQAEANRLAVIDLVGTLPAHDARFSTAQGPVWTGVDVELVLNFLRAYRVDGEARSISLPLTLAYIERCRDVGELTRWTVAVRGLSRRDKDLGEADWGLPTGPVWQISRSRLGETDSLGVITDPQDEAIGLDTTDRGRTARALRSPGEGLLILYPISRHSGHDVGTSGNRRRLFDDPTDPRVRDLVAFAISFPRSDQPQQVEAFMQGTAPWRPVE